MIVDMHCHIVPREFPSIAGLPTLEPIDEQNATMMIEGEKFRSFRHVAWDATSRIEDFPNIGVDKQVLSPLPELLMYHLTPAAGAALATHLNSAVAQMMHLHPEKYLGLGSIPMQDVGLAIAELARIKELGLQGIEIRTNVEGKNLGDPDFMPIFTEAERLGLAVFVHAYKPTFSSRLDHMPNDLGADAAIGFGIECGLAGASLIWGGVLARLPELRVCMSHGGGVLAQLLARSDNNYRNRQPIAELLPEPPMEYARRMYYDDLAWNVRTLRYLIDSMGASQVGIGTDYSGASVRTISIQDELDALELSKRERNLVSQENAERFLAVRNR